MKNFAGHEIKNKLTFRGLLFLFISTLLVIFFSIEGGNKYKESVKKSDIFIETEKTKVNSFQNYPQYGTYGVSIKLVPGKNFALFSDSGAVKELIFTGDSGERFKLFSGKKGANLFQEKQVNIDFSGIVFYICSFLAIYLGYNSLRNSDYIKFLSQIFGKKRVFVKVILKTIFFVNMLYIFFLGVAIFILFLQGIAIDFLKISYYVIAGALNFTLLTVFGASVGRFNPLNRFTALFLIIAIIVMLPFAIGKIVDIDAKDIKLNEILEQDNVKTIMRIEKKYKENFAPYKDGEVPDIKLLIFIDDNLEKEHKEIAAREEKMSLEMHTKVKNCHLISIFFPITFYNITCTELSGYGFKNVIDFYNHARQKKNGFINFYVQKRFYQAQKGKVEAYLKDYEYIFWGKSNLPHMFGLGVMIAIVYIAIAICFTYNRYNKLFKEASKKKKDFLLIFVNKLLAYYITRDHAIEEYIYYCAVGTCSCGITLNEKPVQKIDFIYLPHHSKIPFSRDELIKLLNLNRDIYGNLCKWELLATWAAKTGKVIIMQNFLDGLFDENVKNLKNLFFRENIAALNVGSDVHHYRNLADIKLSWKYDGTVEKGRINDICESEKEKIKQIEFFYNN